MACAGASEYPPSGASQPDAAAAAASSGAISRDETETKQHQPDADIKVKVKDEKVSSSTPKRVDPFNESELDALFASGIARCIDKSKNQQWRQKVTRTTTTENNAKFDGCM